MTDTELAASQHLASAEQAQRLAQEALSHARSDGARDLAELERPPVARVEVVRVQPGDVLVLTCEQHLTEADVTRIREQIERSGLGGLEAVVLDGGTRLAVVRRDEERG